MLFSQVRKRIKLPISDEILPSSSYATYRQLREPKFYFQKQACKPSYHTNMVGDSFLIDRK